MTGGLTIQQPSDTVKIAVYSGSFNPLHIGHLAIMRYLASCKDFDGVYLVVSPKNPIKDNISADSGMDRYMAARRAVRRHPELNVFVDDIEIRMPAPQYTINTLGALRQREPGNEFTLIIGADNLQNIRRWKEYKRILSEYGIAVYPRKGIDIEAMKKALMEEDGSYKIKLLDAPLVNISSSDIREGFAEGKDMSEWLM
jgi:nicotinate-nucleotide adenylyltransferase